MTVAGAPAWIDCHDIGTPVRLSHFLTRVTSPVTSNYRSTFICIAQITQRDSQGKHCGLTDSNQSSVCVLVIV